MQKSLCFALVLSLTLNGCGVFRRSETWVLVRGVRVDTRAETDPSQAYATELSARLAAANIEHKVVTYQFRYHTYLREEAITTRTAVVYRDDTRPAHPWWLMEERLYQPVWLPNDDLGRQISFYLHDYAEVVETRDVPGKGGAGGKVMLATRHTARPVFAARSRDAGRTPMLVPFRTSPARAVQLRGAVASIEDDKLAAKRRWMARRQADGPMPIGELTRPRGERDSLRSSLFSAMHGTAFDPLSPVDRRKMRQLRQTGLVRGVKTARAF